MLLFQSFWALSHPQPFIIFIKLDCDDDDDDGDDDDDDDDDDGDHFRLDLCMSIE